MNTVAKLTPKQEKMARIVAEIFEMSGMSTAEASRVLECLLEVTKPAKPPTTPPATVPEICENETSNITTVPSQSCRVQFRPRRFHPLAEDRLNQEKGSRRV